MFLPHFFSNNLISLNPLYTTSHPCRPIRKYLLIITKPMLSHFWLDLNDILRDKLMCTPHWGSPLMQYLKNWPRITLFGIQKHNLWSPINLEHPSTRIMSSINSIVSKDTLPLNACSSRIMSRTSLTRRRS